MPPDKADELHEAMAEAQAEEAAEEAELLAMDVRSAAQRLRLDLHRASRVRPLPITAEVTVSARGLRLVLEQVGQQTGKQGRQRRTPLDDARLNGILKNALDYKLELRLREGLRATGANSAEDRAAADAADIASKRYGWNIAASTMKTLMRRTSRGYKPSLHPSVEEEIFNRAR